MANNRLLIKCKHCGDHINIAKYYPCSGWYATESDQKKFFEEHDHREEYIFPREDEELFELEHEIPSKTKDDAK